jgi:hypothetical protein
MPNSNSVLLFDGAPLMVKVTEVPGLVILALAESVSMLCAAAAGAIPRLKPRVVMRAADASAIVLIWCI